MRRPFARASVALSAFVAVFALAVPSLGFAQSPTPVYQLLHVGTLIDGTGKEPRKAVERAQTGQLPRFAIPKALEVAPVMRTSFKNACAAGVKIAFGTDAGVFPHGQNAREFKLMTDLGMKPMDAIVAATGGAADLLGWDEVGTVEAGRYADFVVVDGDPLADVTVLERPVAVLKSGQFAKDDRKP